MWPPSFLPDWKWPCTKFNFAHPIYLQGNGSTSYMKVIGQGRGHRNEKGWKSLFLQCKTLSGHNSGSIKHRAMRFACCMGFMPTADRMVWPLSLSCDWKWPCISKCTCICRWSVLSHQHAPATGAEIDAIKSMPESGTSGMRLLANFCWRHFWSRIETALFLCRQPARTVFSDWLTDLFTFSASTDWDLWIWGRTWGNCNASWEF